MIHRIWALIIKEFVAIWKDNKSRSLLIIPPITQLLIFAFAATLDVKDVTMGVLDRDQGHQGYELVQRFYGSKTFKTIHFLNSVDEIAPFIEKQKGVMVLSIAPDFSEKIDAKKPANIQLILDGRKSNTAQVVAGYTRGVVSRFNNDLVKFQIKESPKTKLVVRNWFNPNLYFFWTNVPALVAILTMLIGLLVTALSVAREREMGTFDQLLVSPLKPFEILAGKSIPAVLISIVEGSIIVLIGIYVFGVPFNGSFLLLYSSMVCYILSIVGVGLLLSAICKTQQQAILAAFVFLAPSVMLSGFATPVENMPIWLQNMTLGNPVRYFVTISRGIFLKDMPIGAVWNYTWPLLIIALFTLSGAGFVFKKFVKN